MIIDIELRGKKTKKLTIWEVKKSNQNRVLSY